MTIQQALEALKEQSPVVVRDTTFEPESMDIVQLETGEKIYWFRDAQSRLLTVDVASDEVMLFEELGEQLMPEGDVVVYTGEEYELSFEGEGILQDEEGEELDNVEWQDYEHSRGDVLRIVTLEVTGDSVTWKGISVTEEDLQDV